MTNPGRQKKRSTRRLPVLTKCSTGIRGLDEITQGGLPCGRPTLVCGAAGCGKTLLAMEFLVRGALEHNEPGVFMAFEETPEELAQNVASLGFNLDTLVARKKLLVEYVHVERSEIEETGEYDLEGLFVRLGHAIDTVGAKRVVLDTLETLFGGFTNENILRAELRRLFRWLKDRGVTAIITAERGQGSLTRHGLEEYVSDCVILLDHRVTEQTSTRRLRVVKYRGSQHGTNEYPFLIGKNGFSVIPITSLLLEHKALSGRISSGVPGLDAMLGGQGYYRGSSVLVSGTAGTGKSSLAAHFARACCARGERCLYFAFEESPDQIQRNMRSIGVELSPWVAKGNLRFHASRPGLFGLEAHLAAMQELIEEFRPQAVVMDPITNLVAVGSAVEVNAMLVRLVDFLKSQGITVFFTSLTSGGDALERTNLGISSLMDTWLLLRDIELNGERNRGLCVLKSRGMNHSNQIREFVLSARGIQLLDAYVGAGGVVTGSARLAQAAQERDNELSQKQQTTRRQRELQHKGKALAAQIAALDAEFAMTEEEFQTLVSQEQQRTSRQQQERLQMARSRHTQAPDAKGETKKRAGK